MNLYSNLLETLSLHGKTVDDIDWIECRDEEGKGDFFLVENDDFKNAAVKTNWDESGWNHELNPFLKIHGKNRSFLITIGDYDGQNSLYYVDMEVEKPTTTEKIETFHTKTDDNCLCSRFFGNKM